MKRKKGNIFVKFICITAFCAVTFMGFCEAVAQDLSQNLVRIHVIANSNSDFDQSVKLAVRDCIIKEANTLAGDMPLTLEAVNAQKKKLEHAANRLLNERGASYSCRIETGRFSFPTRQYANITLPQGDYDAVRVILGKGGGENWWCVMYPPLCFLQSAKGESTEALSNSISPVTERIIDTGEVKLKPSIKAIELWQAFKKKIENQNLQLTFVN